MNNTISMPISYEKRISSKNGREYECLVLKITADIEKLIFINPAEKELLKLKYPQLFK